MDTNKLTNSVVRSAFEAWQRGDSAAWLAHFAGHADFRDDGYSRDFRDFSTQAIGQADY